MSEESQYQENSYLPSPRFEFQQIMRRQSFKSDYNEYAEWQEIQKEQDYFQSQFEYFEQLLWRPDEYKKENDFQTGIKMPGVQDQQKQSELLIPIMPMKPIQEPSKDETVKPKKFLDKSFCRYIMLYAIRTIENQQYAEIIRDICSQFQVNYNTFVEYYRKQRILIMGYRALKDELIYDSDTLPNQNRKKAFKVFLVWYLDKFATKHILLSKKQNIKEYLKFKNYVMSYYVHNPKSWIGNKPQWK
ncbi:unnamed protein product [Paramecium pentaurelia]|uniref:Uncharacterized protein n=1 Tax=Paramecium pentaurelia TaxID=43138 RepID=A0A8S1Y614_9CILI|nr:unnamed protein product [Paramecium pentaurelia]CAD8209289.1 unnamed protein product [Paramecium pentaurelia]